MFLSIPRECLKMSRTEQSPSPLLESENGDNETPGAQAQTGKNDF
jgi:hypothetical protein